MPARANDGINTGRRFLTALLLILAAPQLRGQPQPAAPGLVIDVLLDTSSSIKGKDCSAERSLVLDVFDELPPGTKMGITAFATGSSRLIEPTSDREAIDAVLSEDRSSHDSQDLVTVLSTAAAEAPARQGSKRSFFLLTDGSSLPLPSRRPSDRFSNLLARIKAAGVPFLVVDIRGSRATTLMALAAASGGHYETLDATEGFLLAKALADQARSLETKRSGTMASSSSPQASQLLRVGEGSSPIQLGPPRGNIVPSQNKPRRPRSHPTQQVRRRSGAPLPAWLWILIAVVSVAGCLTGLRLAQRSDGRARFPHLRRTRLRGTPGLLESPPEPPAPAATIMSSLPVVVPTPPAPHGKLRLAKGNGVGNLFALATASDTLVGRGVHAHVRIVDPHVGAEHFRIVPAAAGLTLSAAADDLPVAVNDVRVREHLLSPGDVISLGSTQLEFLAD